MYKTSFVLIFLFLQCYCKQNVLYQQPEQVHLSLGHNASEMIVTWLTINKTATATVEYGINDLGQSAQGISTLFVDGGSEKRSMYIHRVTLKNLKPKQRYIYHCGSTNGWSDLFSFVTINDQTNWSPRLAIYGDMGNVNAQSIPRLQEDVQRGMYDVILHVGDFAYDFDTDNARVGDEFMRQLEPVAANIPYMTCPGNHEEKYNFSNYYNRFTMVNKDTNELNNHFYSFNLGPAHIISFSTEFYYYVEYGWDQIGRQFEWLEKDLQEANQPENRALRPWIITMGHKPLYCCSYSDTQCSNLERKVLKDGIKIKQKGNPKYGLEELFYKYGVDIEFYAHEHNYQRLFPVYKDKVYNGTKQNPYDNPKAPVHIVTGSAGCQERHSSFSHLPDWSAFRSNDYGYTRMYIHNRTHIQLEQVSDDKNGKIIDKVLVIKNVHGPEAWL